MKIYINTENQLPVFASTLPTITEENGVLRVYEQGSSGTVSSLIFKRGTTVSIEFVLVGTGLEASQVNDLAFGIKLKGKYDDFLVIEAAADSCEKTDEGISCKVTAVFDSQVIDNALAVNGDSSDDIESADFIGAVSWKGSDGQVTETATVDVEIRNNVIRDGDGIAGDGLPSGVQWTALMVVRMSWADYQALCEAGEDREDVLYVCPDAPDKETELGDSISALEERVTVNESDISAIEKNYDALEQRVDNIDANGADLSEYAKLDADQTFTGANTFSSWIYVANGSGLRGAGSVSLYGSSTGTGYVFLYGSNSNSSSGSIYFYGSESGIGSVGLYGSSSGRGSISLYGSNSSSGSVYFYGSKVGSGQVYLYGSNSSSGQVYFYGSSTNSGSVYLYGSSSSSGSVSIYGSNSSSGSVSIYGSSTNSTAGTINIGHSVDTVKINGTATLNGEEIATVGDLADYAKLSGADFTGTLSVNGSEVALKSDIKDVDLTGYAKLSGADFTGTLSVNGSEVALKSDIKDVDLTGYAKEDWVKEYHSADIEELKEWVKEELQKTEAGAQAAAIEELQGQVKDLEDAVYCLILTIEVPEANYEFHLWHMMEGDNSQANYTNGNIPKYDFSVNWGDGSSDSYTNENWSQATHTFAAAGEYILKIYGTFEYLGLTGYRSGANQTGSDTMKLLTGIRFGK